MKAECLHLLGDGAFLKEDKELTYEEHRNKKTKSYCEDTECEKKWEEIKEDILNDLQQHQFNNETFIKNDTLKPNLAILFDTGKALEEVANVMEYGAKKYSRKNWDKVDDKERYMSATLRHLNAYHSGEIIDDESGMNHLAHAVCSLLFLLEIDKRVSK